MTVLFLDFDGVLHPERPTSPRFTQLPLVESVLRRFPDVEVVLTTTWRLKYALQDLKSRFAPDIQPRIIGVTPHQPALYELPVQLWSFARHAEIVSWVNSNRPGASWIAVDDGVHLFMPFSSSSVLYTDPTTGFTESDAIELANRLRALGEREI